MIGAAIISALQAKDAPFADGRTRVALLDAAGEWKATWVQLFLNLLAVEEDFSNIDPNLDKRVLISVDASEGVPLTAFGGETVTRTSAVTIQVVAAGTTEDHADSRRPIVNAVTDRLVTWLIATETPGKIASTMLAARTEQNVALAAAGAPLLPAAPTLLSLVVQDATPDGDENYERTVILVEAVTVPNP